MSSSAVVALIAIGPKELPGGAAHRRPVHGQDPPHGVGIPGPVPGGDARGRDGRPEEARSTRWPTPAKGLTDFDPLGDGARKRSRASPPTRSARRPRRSRRPQAPRRRPRRMPRPRRCRLTPTIPRRRRTAVAPEAPQPAPSPRAPSLGERRVTTEEDEKEIEASKAPLMTHLIELRSRLIKALAAFFVAAAFCFFFAKPIYNILVWPYVLGRRRRELQVHLHRAARILHHPTEAVAVRRGLHLVPGGRGADLHVRRAGPLPPRARRVPAVSDRDAVLLRARRARWSISS